MKVSILVIYEPSIHAAPLMKRWLQREAKLLSHYIICEDVAGLPWHAIQSFEAFDGYWTNISHYNLADFNIIIFATQGDPYMVISQNLILSLEQVAKKQGNYHLKTCGINPSLSGKVAEDQQRIFSNRFANSWESLSEQFATWCKCD